VAPPATNGPNGPNVSNVSNVSNVPNRPNRPSGPVGRRAPSSAPRRPGRVSSLATALLGLGVLGLGTGCELLLSSATPEEPLWRRHPSGALGIAFRRELTAPARKGDPPYERGKPAIDPAHRRVFVGSSDHGLYALRAEDGGTLWRFETLGPVQSEPFYDEDDDVLYFGSNDGALYKVRAVDGKLLWRFMTNAEVARKPVKKGNTLYATNANDTLVAIDVESGKLKWTQHRTPAFGMEIAGHAGPALGKEAVFVAFSDGSVTAYAQTDGTELWPTVDLAAEAEQITGEPPRYLDVDTTPLVMTLRDQEVVVVASYAGGVFALDAYDGTRVWVNEGARGVTELLHWQQPERAAGKGQVPYPARSIVFASSGQSGLWALDPTDGKTVWRRDLPEGGMSAPVPFQGGLLVSTTRYGLYLMHPLDGGVIDAMETGGGYSGTPAAHGRRAYALSNGGSFVSIDCVPPPRR
jgi:outer membrane protein assembly factor BamB